ncbi:BTAD domain-containing putative transcriptional regulator [Micromonospora costi]|uniref:BTAD domain-containing putative transcriptional regulator n=1 Tax=Micromonospora costi TaxID=1530042 RepID=UPI00240DE9ED|nr:BTAD domain-containing putative transcriptional regulator [Micromonospora costi]
MNADLIIALACAAATALWLLLITAVFTHVYNTLARRVRGNASIRLPSPIQSLAAALLGATAVTTVTGATAHAHQATTTSGELPATEPATATPTPQAIDRADPPSAEPATPTYTVRRGDSLCRIAARTLGDPDRWPEIYALNRGTHFPHVGGTLRDPNLIYPGWELELPTDPAPSDAPRPAPPQRNHDAPTEPGPQPSVPSTHPSPSGDTSSAATPSTDRAAASPATPGAAPTATGPGGAAGSPPPATAPATSPPPTSSPSAGNAEPTRLPTGQPNQPHGILLPSGSWLDLGLAAAITTAVALIWAHRRRRYTRRPPSPDLRLAGSDLAPMRPVVNQIRRRLRHTQPAPGSGEPRDARPDSFDDAHDRDLPSASRHDDVHSDPEPPHRYTAHQPSDVHADDSDNDLDGDEQAPSRQHRDHEPTVEASTPPRPVVPSSAHPLSTPWPPAGLGLTGPAADAAARGCLAAALASGGPNAPTERTHVVMPSATAATLLGTDAALPHTPRLAVTASLDEALDLLETQALHRSRLVHAHDVNTVADLRTADPTEEPVPPVLLLAEATTRRQRTRIAALLAQGGRLDIHGVLLGAWPDGDTIVVKDDGTTTPADTDATRRDEHPADIGRLAVLTPADTLDLLVTLAESHTGQPQTPAVIEPTPPAGQPAHASAAQSANRSTAGVAGPPPTQNPTNAALPPASDTAEDLDRVALLDIKPAETDTWPGHTDGSQHHRSTESDAASGDRTGTHAPSEGDERRHHGRVQVNVLGPPGIVDAGPRPTLRKKSLEVLVYLAVHDGQARVEAILDDLLPDAPASKAPGRLYTYVSDLRAVMRRIGGAGIYLTHPSQRYALNPDRIDVDLWRMRAAIRDADQASTPQARVAALRRAVDTYRGHFADGATYEWIEPYREAVRQQALDAYLALTDALADNPAEQLAVLATAIRHNPYTEELYQQAMCAHAALGHLDAIRSLRRALTRALSEIDAEPGDHITALADDLIARMQRPGHHVQPPPASLPGRGDAA